MINRESTCPLCGSRMTDYHDSYSDGDECVRASIGRNVCKNHDCRLPVRLWEDVESLLEYKRLFLQVG